MKEHRNISFEIVLQALIEGEFQGILEYQGTKKIHQGQKILLVRVFGETWKVPHTIENEFIFLRTAYPA